MIDFRDRPEWKLGAKGEEILYRILIEQGYFVNMKSAFSLQDGRESAPVLVGSLARLIMPDLDIAKHGIREWAEVKTKTAPTYYRKGRTWDHGIGVRHVTEYLAVQKTTGCRVWIFILELLFGAVLRLSLNDWVLAARQYHGHRMSRGGMLFVPRGDLEIFGHWQGEARARGDFLPWDPEHPLA